MIPTASDKNMVRFFIIGAAFLTVTLALVLLQPGSTALDEPAAAPTALASQTQVEPAEETVTRAQTDLTDLALAATAAEASSSQISDDVARTVLAALKSAETAPTTAAQKSELRNLTSSIVANLSGANLAQTAKTASIEDLIVQALQKGQSDAYVDALLNEAHDQGAIHVPAALQTSEGRVDTGTLLAQLVAKSSPAENAAPRIPLDEMDGVEVRVVQRAGETKQYNFYTVQSGDSLGAIAHRFYGDAALYTAIFQANRARIATPNSIRVGQRLTIPEITSG